MVFGFLRPQRGNEAFLPENKPERQKDYQKAGQEVGKNEILKALSKPGEKFSGIPNQIPEDPKDKREYLLAFWKGVQSVIREHLQYGDNGVFVGNTAEWEHLDEEMGERITQAAISFGKQNYSAAISMADVQTEIERLLSEIPLDALRPVLYEN